MDETKKNLDIGLVPLRGTEECPPAKKRRNSIGTKTESYATPSQRKQEKEGGLPEQWQENRREGENTDFPDHKPPA